MAEDQLLKDFNKQINLLVDVKSWLEKLYYDPEFSSVFNRPAISMLITGTDFLITNLYKFKRDWEDIVK